MREGKAKFTNAAAQHGERNQRKRIPTEQEGVSLDVRGVQAWDAGASLRLGLGVSEVVLRRLWRDWAMGRKVGFPKFKRKGADTAFGLTGAIRVEESRQVVVPRIGRIRVKEKTDTFSG